MVEDDALLADDGWGWDCSLGPDLGRVASLLLHHGSHLDAMVEHHSQHLFQQNLHYRGVVVDVVEGDELVVVDMEGVDVEEDHVDRVDTEGDDVEEDYVDEVDMEGDDVEEDYLVVVVDVVVQLQVRLGKDCQRN